jgi:signal transduction histidine kinase
LKGKAMNDTGLIELQSLESAPFATTSAISAQHPELERLLGSDSVAALAHDARNLITALGLYCDLLDEPGVLAPPFAHYRNELRLVAAAGRRLVSKLVAQGERSCEMPAAALPDLPFEDPDAPWLFPVPGESTGMLPEKAALLARKRSTYERFDDEFAATPISNLAAELLAIRNLLAALAGPGIAVTVDAEGGACGVQLTAEDLTRILVNLVRNAADAMPSGGRIHISLTEVEAIGTNPIGQTATSVPPARLVLTFDDNGPGVSPDLLSKIFDRGFTTHSPVRPGENWATFHRGLGLAISRSIIESAFGRIEVTNRPGGGARFLIELPAI